MLVIAHDKSLESSSISEVSSSLPNLPDDHQRLAGFTFAREQHQVSLIRPVLDLFSDRLGLFRGQRSRHDNISPPTVGRPDRGTTSEERLERLERRPADASARPSPRSRVAPRSSPVDADPVAMSAVQSSSATGPSLPRPPPDKLPRQTRARGGIRSLCPS